MLFDAIRTIILTSKYPCWKLYYFQNHEKISFGSFFPTDNHEETINQSLQLLEQRLELNPDAEFGIYIQEKPQSNGDKVIGLLRFRYKEKNGSTPVANHQFAGFAGFDFQGVLAGLENQQNKLIEAEKAKADNLVTSLKHEFSLMLEKKDLERQKEELNKRIAEFEQKQKEIEAPAYRMGKILETALGGIAEKYLPTANTGLAGVEAPTTEEEQIVERIAGNIFEKLKTKEQLLQLEQAINQILLKVK
jgi:hypothetical protein